MNRDLLLERAGEPYDIENPDFVEDKKIENRFVVHKKKGINGRILLTCELFYDNQHLCFSPANQRAADNKEIDLAEFTHLDLRTMARIVASFNSEIRDHKNEMNMIQKIHALLVGGHIEELPWYHINYSTLNIPALVSIVFVYLKNPIIAGFGKAILILYGLNFSINLYKFCRHDYGDACGSVTIGKEQQYFDQVIKPAALLDQKRNRPTGDFSIKYKNKTFRYINSLWLTLITAMIVGSVCVYLSTRPNQSASVQASELGLGIGMLISSCCTTFCFYRNNDQVEMYSKDTNSISLGNQSAFFPERVEGKDFTDTDIVISTKTPSC